MAGFIGQIQLTAVLSVLLFIASIWLLVIILQKRSGYMFRAMVFFLFVLLALIYLQQSDAKKYTLDDLRLIVFPEKQTVLDYRLVEGKGDLIASYIFANPKPRIALSMEPSGKFFHITNVRPINKVLSHLKLPILRSGVKELASITGSNRDSTFYKWVDYPRGVLILRRNMCRDRKTFDTYHCLEQLTIKKKFRN